MDRRFDFNFSSSKAAYNLMFDAGNSVVLNIWYNVPGRFLTEIYGLSEILDYLKEELPEQDFREVVKFCFENI